MMRGFFNVEKMPARGLRDEDFQQAIDAGCINQLLTGFPVTQKCGGSNRIFDNAAGYMLDKLFSLGNCGWPYYISDGGGPSIFNSICLATTDGDTTSYTEDWTTTNNDTTYMHKVSGSANTSSGAKRFEEDQIENWTSWTDTDGREAIHFRNKWLYLPTQGTSTDIRSIVITFCTDGDSTGGYSLDWARTGRVRLKDENGNKIILVKNSNEILLVEYTFTLVAM
jgi:hypothetical protein